MACYSPIREPCEFQSRTGGPGETREVETNLSNPYIIPTQPIRNGQTATAAEPQVTTDNKHARRGLLNHNEFYEPTQCEESDNQGGKRNQRRHGKHSRGHPAGAFTSIYRVQVKCRARDAMHPDVIRKNRTGGPGDVIKKNRL